MSSPKKQMSHARRPQWLVLASTTAAAVALSAAACGGDDGISQFDAGSSGQPDGAGSSGSSGNLGIGDDSGNGRSDAAFNADAACAVTTVEAKRAPASLLFVIDRSGSMNCNPPPTTTSAVCEQFPITADTTKASKWTITRNALKAALAAMPATNSAGISLFNTDDDCAVLPTPGVLVKPLDPTQKTALNASLDAVTPKGFTPIVGGATLGYQYLHTTPGIVGKKFLVLITDGEETCAPDQQEGFVTTTVQNAGLVGIKTFVIGAPGSEENRAFLSRMAFNGGTARSAACVHAVSPANAGDCHFDLTNSGVNLATELNAALDSISREALGCEFDVPKPGSGTIDYGKVNVLYTPSGGGAARSVPQDNSAGCTAGADGWQYSADRSKIFLCGNACNTVKADQNGRVDVALGCTTVVR